MMPGRISFFRLRQRSLLRGVLVSLGAMAASLRLAGFPHENDLHASNWQLLVLPLAGWGMAETARCLSRKWSFYHAAVLILLCTDLMILLMVLFLWLYL
jgi:hypothetical protein